MDETERRWTTLKLSKKYFTSYCYNRKFIFHGRVFGDPKSDSFLNVNLKHTQRMSISCLQHIAVESIVNSRSIVAPRMWLATICSRDFCMFFVKPIRSDWF